MWVLALHQANVRVAADGMLGIDFAFHQIPPRSSGGGDEAEVSCSQHRRIHRAESLARIMPSSPHGIARLFNTNISNTDIRFERKPAVDMSETMLIHFVRSNALLCPAQSHIAACR
jgi:hypothetical protein